MSKLNVYKVKANPCYGNLHLTGVKMLLPLFLSFDGLEIIYIIIYYIYYKSHAFKNVINIY